MYEASRWHTDERFLAPMIIHGNGEQIFIGDIVTFQDPSHGLCYGKAVKFMTEVINNVHSELTTSSRFACLTDSKKEIRDKLYS